MRVTTAFNRMLGLAGGWVRDVEFGSEAVIVTVALQAKKPMCSGCGARGLPIKEQRTKPWRHLDLGGLRCRIECRLRRLYCPGCGDVYERVPWARAGSRHTRDFEDLTAWLAQQMSQTQLTKLMRIGWETVGNIVTRVVAEKLPAGRLDGLELIGVDEVSYGADHKFLTRVANHDSGGIVWATEGRNAASLQAFFDGLTDEQKASIRAVSIDMSAGYEKTIRSKEGVPHAQVPEFWPILRRLRAFRGIDTLSALILVLEVSDFGRFARAVQLGSWLGLVPSREQSGESDVHGSITKRPAVKSEFVV